jgi:uncharacterized membrane protein (UPF0127 family)
MKTMTKKQKTSLLLSRETLKDFSFFTAKPCLLENMRTKELFAQHVMVANNLWEQSHGLMLRKLSPKSALIFNMRKPRRFSLHMCFVFRSIDVAFCNNTPHGLLIVDIKHSFKPFTTYTAVKTADLFIEFPEDTLKNARSGDLIIPKSF